MWSVLILPLVLALLAGPATAQPLEETRGGAEAPEAGIPLPTPPPVGPGGPFQIVFQLHVGNESAIERAEVELDLASGVQVVPLLDDGSVLEDRAWDGVYVGTWRGPFLRWAQLRLVGGRREAPEVLSEGIERFHDRYGGDVAWRLVPGDGRFTAVRTAATPLTGTDDIRGRVELLASFGWAVMLAIYLALLALWGRGRQP